MPNTQPIQDRITNMPHLDKRIILKWNTALPDLLASSNNSTIKIDGQVVGMFIYDFYGLLNHIGIDPEFWYPYLLANDYYQPYETTMMHLPDK